MHFAGHVPWRVCVCLAGCVFAETDEPAGNSTISQQVAVLCRIVADVF